MKKCSLLALMLVLVLGLFAQGQPESTKNVQVSEFKLDQPIRITVQTKAGGALDVRARILGKYLENELGVSVIIQNKPGAGGMLAITEFVNQPGGPYDLIFVSDSPFTTIPLFNKVQYTWDDLVPVIATDKQPTGLFVNPAKTGINSFAELVEYGKSKEITYGSGGVGNITHLLQAALYKDAGMTARTVVHDGANQGLINTLGGHVDVTYSGLALAKGFVEDGSLKCIVTFEDKPYSGYEGVDPIPSILDEGYDYLSGDLIFMAAKKGMNENAYNLIYQACMKIYKDAQFLEDFAKIGVEDTEPWSREEVDAYIRSSIGLYSKLKTKI